MGLPVVECCSFIKELKLWLMDGFIGFILYPTRGNLQILSLVLVLKVLILCKECVDWLSVAFELEPTLILLLLLVL